MDPGASESFSLSGESFGQLGGLGRGRLALELQEIQQAGFDLQLTGFDPGEIDSLLLSLDGDLNADAAPPAPASPVSRTGDLWLLGPHRVLCGDATVMALGPRLGNTIGSPDVESKIRRIWINTGPRGRDAIANLKMALEGISRRAFFGTFPKRGTAKRPRSS